MLSWKCCAVVSGGLQWQYIAIIATFSSFNGCWRETTCSYSVFRFSMSLISDHIVLYRIISKCGHYILYVILFIFKTLLYEQLH